MYYRQCLHRKGEQSRENSRRGKVGAGAELHRFAAWQTPSPASQGVRPTAATHSSQATAHAVLLPPRHNVA